VPRAGDIPPFTTILAERGDGVGVHGAKGGGEGALNPVAAAIANALSDALGLQIDRMPISPSQLHDLIHA
jgi:CO/xanthine dehydrogenase Mo-binding subunit